MSRFITYRPEIDGLRTVAVLSVIFYHVNFNLFGQNPIKGGFLGVDIFFVISGYLITSILLNGFETKTLTLQNFYERRARRILPILLFVITASIPLSWVLLLPSEFQQYSWQTLSSIFSASNFYFWTEDSYWAAESILKPFLHTWSLGIEEQFYVFMPLLLLFITNQTLRQIRYLLLTLAILSLVASHYMSSKDAQSSFYLLPFRAWELLIGASIATLRDEKLSNLKFSFFPTVGLAVVLICFFVFDEDTLHPSFYTLIPTLGVGLIILFANPKDPTTKLLQNRIMTSIGLISYGLYLWHFPVFSYLSHAGEFQNSGIKIGAIGLIFLLSTATYFLIERPFRSFSLIKSKLFWLVTGFWGLSLTVFAYNGIGNGFASRIPKMFHPSQQSPRVAVHEWYRTSKEKKGRIILVGDSHVGVLSKRFKEWSVNNGYDFALSHSSGCQLILGMERVYRDTLKPKFPECNVKNQDSRMNWIVESKPAIVLVGGRLPLIVEETRVNTPRPTPTIWQNSQHNLNSKKMRQNAISNHYKETIQTMTNAGHTVVLYYPTPESKVHVPKRIFEMIGKNFLSAREKLIRNPITIDYEQHLSRVATSHKILDSINDNRVFRLHPDKIFCNTSISGKCVFHDTENLFYQDSHHLSTDAGANKVLQEFVTILSLPNFAYQK
ncbi:MAG: hypothetical protein CMO26_07570 [Thiotrichales bacterium]|nr:hypothetical protein [Thiotrichales bacterium]|tara:strand:+ start:1403 stop:3400 length:1998 start_codon:yes stop_codon:yes gene_type:complete